MEDMQIIKIINNNVICALNERHQERILAGKGVGFQKKPGDTVDMEKVEKEYILKSRTVISKLNSLFTSCRRNIWKSASALLLVHKKSWEKN